MSFDYGWSTSNTASTYTITLPASEPPQEPAIKASLEVKKFKGELSPSIYIKHVKSKFTKVEKERLDARRLLLADCITSPIGWTSIAT